MNGEIRSIEKTSGKGKYQHGLVGITLYNTKDNVTRDYGLQENFITPVGKEMDNIMGPGRLLSVGADMFGETHIHQSMTQFSREANYPMASVRGDWRTEMTLVLLHLDTDVNNVTEDTSTLYINDDAGTTYAYKIVGYANGNINPVANGKEGVIDFTKPEYVANKLIHAKRWIFDTDIAVGTIDAVAMMPASIVKKRGGTGISIWTCLDKVNAQDTNFVAFSTQFCIPGITGFTGNDEVLLNYNASAKSKHKVILTTMETEDLEDTEPWFVFPQYASDWIKVDDYFYVLVAQPGAANMTVYVYNATTMVPITNYAISYLYSQYSQYYKCKAAFLYKDSLLYVTLNNYDDIGTQTRERVFKLTKSGQLYFSVWDTSSALTTYVGFLTLPGFITDESKVCIGHFGDKYVMYIVEWPKEVAEYNPTYGGMFNRGFLFTDLADIAGSIVKGSEFYGVDLCTLKFNTATRDGFMRIGTAPNMTAPYLANEIYDLSSGSKLIVNNTTGNASYKEILMNTQGLWISDKTEHGNCYSIRLLTTPVVKGADDKLYVSYGYQRS